MSIIQQKRGTSDRWSSLDPILAAGEIGYETDTGKFKIGDGTTSWSSLSYFSTSSGGSGSGTLTSVGLAVPTGLTVSNSPLTADGTITVAFDTGYSIPTTASQSNWNTAYGWGNHASAGYLTSFSETDTLASVTGRGASTNSIISLTNNTSSTNTTTGALKVTGGVGIQENINVGGNAIITGNLQVDGTTTINSLIATIDDPILTIGGDTAPGSDDNKDRGIAFRWHNGSTAKIGFFGFDDSLQQFTFVPDATITSEVVSGTTGTMAANATSADILSTTHTIWGQNFNGSQDVSGSLTGVNDITSSDTLFSIGTTSVTTASGNSIAITGGTTSNTVGTGGAITLTGGSATSSTGANYGGSINIAAGASTLSTSGTGGSVSILAGNGQTKGTISIGTSNTSAITIGASGITTTIAGTLSATLSNALTISSPLSGGSYNGSSAVSIGLSTGYGDTQNPYGTKSQYYVLAGPTTPTPAAPSFRLLTSADIPDLSGTYLSLSGGTVSGSVTARPSSGNDSIRISGRAGGSSSWIGTITPTTLTASRTYTFPDSSGTVALTSDLSGTYLALSGGTMSGSINLGSNNITNIATATTTTLNATTIAGASSITGATGTTAMNIASADTSAAASGSVTLSSGIATSSTAGVVRVDSGNNGTPGSGGANVGIGTINASSVTIGRTGITTTIAGTLSATIPGIGSTIQAWDADLDAVAALSGTGLAKRTGAGTWTTITDNSTNWDTAYTDRNKWDGGSTGLTPSTGRTSLGATTAGSNIFTLTNPSATTFLKINPDNSVTAESASTHVASLGGTTVGSNIFSLTNPSAITFLRINADNTVTARSAANFRSDIGAGTGNGTVTDLSIVTANGFAGTVATSTTTPAITLTTSVTGLLSGNGTAISAASVGYGDTTNPYGSKTTNHVLAGPAAGPSASPSFRALVSADIPDLSGTYLVVGGNAATATTATNANNINISTTDGNTSDTTMYPVFVGANTTGNQLPHTDVSGFSYNASTNAISTGSISLTGALSAVTTITGISGTTLAISAGGTAGTASSLTGGANTSTTGVGGAVSITGGAATVGTSTATGGSVSIVGGASNTTAGVGGSITINGGLGSSANGNGTISIGTSNTDTITLGESGKVVNFAGAVDLRAGGTTANTAPLYFSSSTSVLATPVAGAVEYNDANFFATPFTTSGRALIESTYFYSNQSTISIAGTSTGGAAISGSAFGVALPLATSTTYQIEAALYLQTSYSTNAPASQTMTFSYPTGTTILTEGIIVQNQAAVTTQTTAGSFYAMQANTNRTITAVTTSGNWHRVSMRGIIRTSTTAGSFSINFGGTNGATPATLQLTLGANSYIKLTPVGSATADNSIGAWA